MQSTLLRVILLAVSWLLAYPLAFGQGTGLTGTYTRIGINPPTFTRVDPVINFTIVDWANGPGWGWPGDYFKAEWTGHIKAKHTGNHRFYTYSDDYAKLTIDGVTRIQHDGPHAPSEAVSGEVWLEAGQFYTIKLEFYEEQGDACIELRWDCDGQMAKEVIPQSCLYADEVPTITVQPQSITAQVGQSANFTVTATGSNLTYQWFKVPGNLAVAQTNPNYTISYVQEGHAGTYYVRVTNPAGSVDSQQVQLTVPPVSGGGGGLSARYFSDKTLSGTSVVSSVGEEINFSWGYSSPKPGIPAEGFSVRWAGFVQPRVSGNYTFYTRTDDGARLWINGQLKINDWVNHDLDYRFTDGIPLIAGQKYSIVMEYFDNTGQATAELYWSGPSTDYSIVPKAVLYPAPAPVITTQPTNQTVASGTKATFSVVVSSSLPVTYQWLRSGNGIPGATTAQFEIPSAQAIDAGFTYSVLVSDGITEVTSSAATLTLGGGVIVGDTFKITNVTYTASTTESHAAHHIRAGDLPEVTGHGPVVAQGGEVVYQSGLSVRLMPGFRATASPGTSFKASISDTFPVVEPGSLQQHVLASKDGEPSTSARAPKIALSSTKKRALLGEEVTVTVTATDEDGDLEYFSAWQDGQQLWSKAATSGSSTTVEIKFTGKAPGSVRFTARAFDKGKASSTLAEFILAVDWSNDATPTGAILAGGGSGGSSGFPAGTLVGTLPGSFSVDNKGSANYSIPLSLPPGRAGLQPSLSLNYSSGSGNGPLGIGWAVSNGFPQSITRGRSIFARDNEVRGVAFTSKDKFYLDGKRLLVVDGTYGQPGSTYRTEVESFATVVTAGTGSNIETFTVTDKSGVKMVFGKAGTEMDGYQKGAGADETLAYAYALKLVEDSMGNTVTFKYEDVTEGGARIGEYVISEIRYTGHTTAANLDKGVIEFSYNSNSVAGAARRDRTMSYTAGRAFSHSRRLDRINVYFGGKAETNRVRYYDLGYDYAPDDGPLRLVQIAPSLRENEAAAFASIPPTQLMWSASSANYSTQAAPNFITNEVVLAAYTHPASSGGAWDRWQTAEFYTFADVNGDGLDDLVDGRTGHLMVSLSTGSGFGTAVAWTDDNIWPGASVLMRLADINGDGRKDVVFGSHFAAGGHLYALISKGSKFEPLDGGATATAIYTFGDEFADSTPNSDYLILRAEQNGVTSRFTLADFTGDGRDDILIHRYNGKLKVLRSNGTGFDASIPVYNVGAEELRNEDPWMQQLFTVPPIWLGLRYPLKFSIRMIPCELNGDGITDYAWIHTEHKWHTWDAGPLGSQANATVGKYLYAVTSLPEGGFSSRVAPVSTGFVASSTGKNPYRNGMANILPGDVNGDGLTDFLALLPSETVTVNGKEERVMRHRLLLSTGGSAEPVFAHSDPISPTVTLPSGGQPVNTYYDPLTAATWENNHFYEIGGLTDPDMIGMFLSFGLGSSGDNMHLHDVNQDGRQDYLWYVDAPQDKKGWWVMYSQGTGFAAPVAVPAAQIPWEATEKYSGGASTRTLKTRQALQLNGDGVPDYAAYTGSSKDTPGVSSFQVSAGRPGCRVIGIVDGFGARTAIAYTPTTDNSIYTSGAAVDYPIRETRSANYVVADVWKDAGGDSAASNWAHFSYQYSGARIDLSGRGSLGFHSFVTLDHQTGLFKYQFLTQSFPMTGLTHREQTYRWWKDEDKHKFRLLSWHDNTVVFDKVDGGNGTLWPFISQAKQSRWEDGPLAHFGLDVAPAISQSEELFKRRIKQPDGAHIAIIATSKFDKQAEPQTNAPQLTLPPATGLSPSDVVAQSDEGDDTIAFRNVVGGMLNVGTQLTSLPGKIQFGNLRELSTDYGDGNTEIVTTTYEDSGGSLVLSGLVASVTTKANGETAPIKRFTYVRKSVPAAEPNQPPVSVLTPLVKTEEIDTGDAAVTRGDPDLKLTTTYTYDSRGRVTETKITGLEDVESVKHIGDYKVSSVDEYDDRFDLPKKASNAAPYGHQTVTGYHAMFGLPKSVADVNGAGNSTVYDALGRATKVKDNLTELEITTDYKFHEAGEQRMVVEPPASSDGLTLTSAFYVITTAEEKPKVTTYYDRLGRPIRVVKEGFAEGLVKPEIYADTVYNILGQVVATSLPYKNNTSVYWTRTHYDRLGRVAEVTAPNGTVTTTTYRGRLTGVTVDARYAFGRVGDDAKLQTNYTLVDAKGRTVKVWNAGSAITFTPVPGSDVLVTPGGLPSIEFKLDGFGRMKETILEGKPETTIAATYDPLGRQISLSDPDKGHWEYTNNALGQVVEQKDARGNVTKSTFDHLGRPVTRTTQEPTAGPTETAEWFYYDAAKNDTLHLVEKGDKGWIGALQREQSSTAGAPGYANANSETVSVHYYDNKGRRSIDLTTVDDKWFYTYTDYDEKNRVKSVRYNWRPKGLENPAQNPYDWQEFGMSYTYDNKSYLKKLTDSGGRVWWDEPKYDYADRLTSVRKAELYTTVRTYRPEDGALTAVKTDAGMTSIQNLAFNYDGLGNLISRGSGALVEGFEYDNLNRLTKIGERVIEYFSNGNIKRKYDVNNVKAAEDYTYYTTTRPHAVEKAWGYLMNYDANGNLNSRTGNGETWDFRYAGFDKPRWMARTKDGGTRGSEFLYNANRSRTVHLEFNQVDASKVPSSYVRKRVYGLGPTLEVEYEKKPAGTEPAWDMKKVRIYLSGPDGTIGAHEFDNPVLNGGVKKTYIYHHDHLGSIDVVTQFASSLVATDGDDKPSLFSEDAWGLRRNPMTWSGLPTATDGGGARSVTPRGFTGHEMLDDLGLVHMNGRIYDGLLGRFLSADTVVQFGNDYQSYNRYSYVKNNPLTSTDPTGFYQEGGHFYTTFMVARAVGMNADRAFRIAYYTQFPDERRLYTAFSSVPDFVIRIRNPALKENLKVMQENIHSLHGLRGAELEGVRTGLRDMVADGNVTDEARGLAVHAFGDSYAHTYIETVKDDAGNERSETVAYKFPEGHAWQNTSPDIVNNRPELFAEYVDALADALSQVSGAPIDQRQIERIRNVPTLLPPLGRSAGEEIAAFRRLAEQEFGYNDTYAPETSDSATSPRMPELTLEQMRATAEEIRNRTRNQNPAPDPNQGQVQNQP